MNYNLSWAQLNKTKTDISAIVGYSLAGLAGWIMLINVIAWVVE